MSEELTIRDIAERAQLSVETVRKLHAEATKARREGTHTPRMMPEPTGTRDSALTWEPEAIDAWLAEREKPTRKGAVPKSVLHQAIKELKRGRTNAALRVLEGAL